MADKLCGSCCYWQPNFKKPDEETPDGKYPCNHADVDIKTKIDFGCVYHLGADSREWNVPDHVPNGTMLDPNQNPVAAFH